MCCLKDRLMTDWWLMCTVATFANKRRWLKWLSDCRRQNNDWWLLKIITSGSLLINISAAVDCDRTAAANNRWQSKHQQYALDIKKRERSAIFTTSTHLSTLPHHHHHQQQQQTRVRAHWCLFSLASSLRLVLMIAVVPTTCRHDWRVDGTDIRCPFFFFFSLIQFGRHHRLLLLLLLLFYSSSNNIRHCCHLYIHYIYS